MDFYIMQDHAVPLWWVLLRIVPEAVLDWQASGTRIRFLAGPS
jgi:hypothetical protein